MIAMTFSPFWCLYPENPIPSPLFWPRCWSRRHGARGDRAVSLPRDAAHSPQTPARATHHRPIGHWIGTRARSIAGLFSRPSSEPDVILLASSGSLVSLSLQLWPIEMDIIMTSLTQWDALAFPRDHDFHPGRHLLFTLFIKVS